MLTMVQNDNDGSFLLSIPHVTRVASMLFNKTVTGLSLLSSYLGTWINKINTQGLSTALCCKNMPNHQWKSHHVLATLLNLSLGSFFFLFYFFLSVADEAFC